MTKNDRRRVLVYPTEKGAYINDRHKEFHDEMAEFVGKILSEEELTVVLKALNSLTNFFTEKINAVKR